MANDPTIFYQPKPLRHREEVHEHQKSDASSKASEAHAEEKSDHFIKTDKLSKEVLEKQRGNLLARLANVPNDGSFESLVKAVLDGAPSLPQSSGGKMILAGKTTESWQTFFKNMVGLGNAETAMHKSLGDVATAFFRGLFKQEADGAKMTLVSDLHLSQADQIITDKFSRILIENPDLLDQLSKLSPGDEIPQDLLKLFGSDITYLQLTHLPDILNEAAKLAARDSTMAHYKSTVNTGAFTRMADALIRERKKDDGTKEGSIKSQFGDPRLPWHYFMSADPRWDRQDRLGKPKFWLFFSYSVGAVMLAIVLYWFLRKF